MSASSSLRRRRQRPGHAALAGRPAHATVRNEPDAGQIPPPAKRRQRTRRGPLAVGKRTAPPRRRPRCPATSAVKYLATTRVSSTEIRPPPSPPSSLQKVQGSGHRIRTPVAAALASPKAPPSLGGSGDRVEIDLGRQLLTAHKGGRLVLISHISSGSGKQYCENGHCGTAITPTGDFKILWSRSGWETAPLGRLYNPQYFTTAPRDPRVASVPFTLHPLAVSRIPSTPRSGSRRRGQGNPVMVR